CVSEFSEEMISAFKRIIRALLVGDRAEWRDAPNGAGLPMAGAPVTTDELYEPMERVREPGLHRGLAVPPGVAAGRGRGNSSETILLICAAMALAFAINLVPAFMPSTWMVMAFFYIKFGLPLLILTIGGAIASALGRILLAKASTLFKRRFMRSRESDLDELGEFLNERRTYVGPAVFAYSLTPLPTNNLFIAAGMAEVNMV